MTMAAFILGLLLVVGSVSAEGIWPSGQEFIYDYSADVRVAQVNPAHVGSKYSIYGKLHLQADGDNALIMLDDLRYKLYNGELPEVHQASPLPIPADASALTTAFRIQYKEGKAKKLFMQKDDPLWALNMKKGFASLLQLDLTQRMRMDEPSAFWGEEDSIFGTCDVGYSFIREEEQNVVTKTVNPVSCKNYPFQQFSNVEYYSCGQQHKENPISSLYKRTYHIKLGDTPLVTDISSEFVVGYTPMKANSDLDYVKIEQKLKLISNQPIEQQLSVDDAQEVQDLTYNMGEQDSLLGTVRDWSQGRVKVDTGSLVNKAVTYLDDILEYQEESHVDAKAPQFKKQGALDYYTSLVLSRMTVDELSSVYSQLSQGSSDWEVAKRDLFVKILPSVGTQAAAITVRNLIRKHKVKTWTAQTMLQTLPFNIKHPSEKLLQEMEELIHLDAEYPEDLRHSAILSFGTLVYRAAKLNNNVEFRNRTVDKYALVYLKNILDAKNDFTTQMVYLQGLDNMRVGKAALILEALVLDGSDYSRHIQHLASWYTGRNVMNNYNKAYRIFWPILVNPQKHLQLRASALTVLVVSASEMDHFMTIHSYMLNHRQDIHLYKLYYKLLKTKTTTTNTCFSQAAEYAQRILRFTPEPLVDHLGTGLEMYDFTDEMYGFGKVLRLQSLADHATGYPSVLYASFHDTISGNNRNPFSVYLKLEGLDQVLWGMIGGSEAEPIKAPGKMDMMGLLQKHQGLSADDIIRKVSQTQGKLEKPIHIELAVYKDDQAIFTLYLNNSVLDRVLERDIPLRLKELKNMFQSLNLHQVDFPAATELWVPTDLGVPLAFTWDHTQIFSMMGSTKLENGLLIETTTRRSNFKANRVGVINPLVGSWHGLQKISSYDSQLPLRLSVQPKGTEKGVKFIFGSPNGAEGINATIGSRWYTQSQSFVFEEESNNNLLGASCAACKRFTPVTKGKDNLKELKLAHVKIPGTGLIADVRVFDCERDISIPSFKKLLFRIFDKFHMNSHDQPLMMTLLGLNHLLMYGEYAPPSGQCGFLAQLVPDPELGGGSQVEFSMKMTGGEIPGGNIVLQGMKLRVIGEWVERSSSGDAIKKLDIKLDLMTTAANENNKLTIQLTNYNFNKAGSKVCWAVTKKFPTPRKQDALAFGWGNEEVDSTLSFTAGSFVEDVDGDCPSDSIQLTINMKGEISDEQKQRAQGDGWPYGQCKLDRQKSEWQNSDFTPTTQACYQGAILLTTAKKVTYSVTEAKVPQYIMDIIHYIEEHYRSALAPYFKLVPGGELTAPGTSQIMVQHSAYKPTVDMTIKTPTRHYSYVDIPTGGQSWNFEYNPGLDNTHFSRLHLLIQNNGIGKPCFVGTENVYTPDNATVPHKQGSEYVLVAGIAGNLNKFSAYTKVQSGAKPMMVKFVNDGVVLELSRDGAKIDGKSVSIDKGVQIPDDDPNYTLRVWGMGDLVMAYSRRTAVFLYYTGQAADVSQPVINRGRASGLCGNLNGDPYDDYQT